MEINKELKITRLNSSSKKKEMAIYKLIQDQLALKDSENKS